MPPHRPPPGPRRPARAGSTARDARRRSVHDFPGDHAGLVELTEQRFTSAGHPQGFGPEASERVRAAVVASLRPAR
ncbi:hypothetical protein KNE206_34010 [Kitasatospora sp. NE20-6]